MPASMATARLSSWGHTFTGKPLPRVCSLKSTFGSSHSTSSAYQIWSTRELYDDWVWLLYQGGAFFRSQAYGGSLRSQHCIDVASISAAVFVSRSLSCAVLATPFKAHPWSYARNHVSPSAHKPPQPSKVNPTEPKKPACI